MEPLNDINIDNITLLEGIKLQLNSEGKTILPFNYFIENKGPLDSRRLIKPEYTTDPDAVRTFFVDTKGYKKDDITSLKNFLQISKTHLIKLTQREIEKTHVPLRQYFESLKVMASKIWDLYFIEQLERCLAINKFTATVYNHESAIEFLRSYPKLDVYTSEKAFREFIVKLPANYVHPSFNLLEDDLNFLNVKNITLSDLPGKYFLTNDTDVIPESPLMYYLVNNKNLSGCFYIDPLNCGFRVKMSKNDPVVEISYQIAYYQGIGNQYAVKKLVWEDN